MSHPPRTALLLSVVLLGLVPVAASAQEPAPSGALEIVVDSSGSMGAADPAGGTKIEAARRALTSVVQSLPAGSRAGVRVYGGRYPDKARGCGDTRLVVPVRAVDAPAATRALAAVRPRGYTPIARSLEAAARDLAGQEPATIVLVSDGEETCGGDPCAVARRLAATGVRLRVDAVGYAVDATTEEQLRCIATATGGDYVAAADAGQLAAQLSRVSSRALRSYQVEGTPVSGTAIPAGAPPLAAGQYVDRFAPSQTRHYTVDLPLGATPYLAATVVRPVARYSRTDYDGATVDLISPQGEPCGSERGYALQYGGGQVAPAVLRLPAVGTDWSSAYDSCGAPGRYTMTVEREPAETAGVVPVEVLVVLEPPVTDQAALPGPLTARPADLPAVAPDPAAPQVAGGGSFNAAPLVGSDGFRDRLRLGETSFWRVPVGWGQRLGLTVVASPAQAGKPTVLDRARVHVSLYDPARQLVDLTSRSSGDDLAELVDLRGTTPLQLSGTSLPVRWRARDASLSRTDGTIGDAARRQDLVRDQQTAALAGEHYLAVRVDLDEEGDAREVPLAVALTRDGAVTGEPAYGQIGTAAAPAPTAASPGGAPTTAAPAGAAPTAAPSPTQTAAPLAAEPVSTSSPWRRVGFGAGGLAALALGAALLAPRLRAVRR